MSMGFGNEVEARVRRIVAELGLPEFVYKQPVVGKGRGVREVGDGLLICGGGGAVLQVKARSRREGLRDSDEEAKRWVYKHVNRAIRQGRGAKRTIFACQKSGMPLFAFPVRAMMLGKSKQSGFQLPLDFDCSAWPVIVVVDHPRNPVVELPLCEDVFCISLRDWRELNRHLRSVHGILRYTKLVLEGGADASVPLGCEYERFSSRARFDGEYAVQKRRTVAPISFAAAKDPIAVEAYHALLENTWGENDELPEFPISDYRSILDFLDDVPSGVQVYAGRWLLNIFDELKSVGHRVSGSVRLGDRPLILMCDFERNRPDKRGWLTDLFALTTARAAEWQEQKGVGRPVLGVGVRVMTAGLEYTYIYLLANEAIGIPIDLRRNIEWRFGIANFSTFETRPLVAGRNEQCPCGINQKYKRCHGLRT